MTEVNEVKAALQELAGDVWTRELRKGTIANATGTGKCLIGINEIDRLLKEKVNPNILLMIPTQVLRDTDWPEEYAKWHPGKELKDVVRAECYAMMPKIKSDVPWDLVIFDEVHHFTRANTEAFFANNWCKAIMGLSATPPDYKQDPITWELVNKYCPVVFEYEIDQGVDDGIVAPYDITVVTMELDDTDKYLEAGSIEKRWMQTEKAAYDYMGKAMKAVFGDKKLTAFQKYQKHDFLTKKRMHFIKNVRSKTIAARKMLDVLLKPAVRTMVFCGSIAQCELLGAPFTWHSKNKKKKPTKKNPDPKDNMDKFREEEFDTLFVVDAANEGVNVPFLDQGIIVQGDSTILKMVQRIGRIVRIRLGYRAMIWILCIKDTQDEKWTKESLSKFRKTNIKWITLKEFEDAWASK